MNDIIIQRYNEHIETIATQAETIERLKKALKGLLEVCYCTNGCALDDMTCASNVARALLAELEER